jgi:hypothetical protein
VATVVVKQQALSFSLPAQPRRALPWKLAAREYRAVARIWRAQYQRVSGADVRDESASRDAAAAVWQPDGDGWVPRPRASHESKAAHFVRTTREQRGMTREEFATRVRAALPSMSERYALVFVLSAEGEATPSASGGCEMSAGQVYYLGGETLRVIAAALELNDDEWDAFNACFGAVAQDILDAVRSRRASPAAMRELREFLGAHGPARGGRTDG